MEGRNLLRRMLQTAMLAIAGGFVLLGAQIVGFGAASSASPVHLRLVDRLDRPKDGNCLDIPGTSPNLRVDLPLFVHNCKLSLTSDSAVVFTDGFIRFPGVDRCITVVGVNSRSLPGASIRLGMCNVKTPYLVLSRLQRFTHRDDGRLTLAGSKLCLTVGSQSAATFSPHHRWRTLFVDDCATATPARSRWEFVVPRS